MKCMWGCGNEGIFECTSFYAKRDGLVKCSKSWRNCPAKNETNKASAEKLKATLKQIDLTKRVQKRRDTLSQTDQNGLSGFKRNAIAVAKSRRNSDGTFVGADKTALTKRNNIVDGKDAFQRASEKTAKTRFGQYVGFGHLPEHKIYKYHVKRITNMQPLSSLKNYERRGAFGKTVDPYQLDHKFSIAQGFLHNIPPYIIGHISNLEMLPAKQNNSKGASCSVTKEALFEGFFCSIIDQVER